MFYENVSLGKERDLPSPPLPEKKNDDMDKLEGHSMPKFEKEIFYDPMEPIDTLDPHLCDPHTRKIQLWLCDTLQDVERHIPTRRYFKEIKKSCRYQGYVVAMRNMIQVKPNTFDKSRRMLWPKSMNQLSIMMYGMLFQDRRGNIL